jgi:hypothetical protein
MNPWATVEIRGKLKELESLVDQVAENDSLLKNLLEEEHVAARISAEQKMEQMEEELTLLRTTVADLRARCRGMAAKARAMRKALNGKGKNPMVDHAQAVFDALKEAAPDHPLVQPPPEE